MNIPLTTARFLGVFRDYNLAVWPAQVVALLVGVACIALAIEGSRSRSVASLVAALWLWTGIVYHAMFFARVNPAAFVFAALFVAQALLLLYTGVVRGSLRFRVRMDAAGLAGGLLIAYALLFYPLLGMVSSHSYPQAPTFGLPCPTTIFTFGLLLWAEPPMPRYLLIIPVAWSIIGLGAMVQFGITEDIGLIVGALVATVLLLWGPKRSGVVAHS
jgi:hypothetical protein